MGIIQRQGIKNTIITYSGFVIGFFSLMIIQPRYLSKDELGLTKVLFSYSALIATFLPLGIQSITLRFFPRFRNHDKRHFGYFGFMIIFPLVGYALAAGLLFLFKGLILQHWIRSELFSSHFNFLFPFVFILSLVNVLSTYSYAIYKTTVPSFLNDILVRLLFIALILVYHTGFLTLNQFLYGYVLIYLAQLSLLLLYILLYDKPGLKIDFSFLKEMKPRSMISFGLLMSVASMASLGLKFLDIIVLEKFVPLSLVGVYAIAAFVPTLIEAPYNSLDRIAAPKVAAAWAHDNLDEIRSIYKQSTRFMLLAGGLLFLGINFNIRSMMSLLPPGFEAGIPVVAVISVGTLINMATGANDSILLNSARYIYGTYLLLFLFVFAFICNLVFIPLWGIIGAAMATAVSAVIYNTLKYLVIYRQFQMQPFDRSTTKIILVIIVTALAAWGVPTLKSPVADMILKSLVISLVYGILAYRLRIAPEIMKYLPFRKSG
jgi:O-antigen/teichoic acid export membrane protein